MTISKTQTGFPIPQRASDVSTTSPGQVKVTPDSSKISIGSNVNTGGPVDTLAAALPKAPDAGMHRKMSSSWTPAVNSIANEPDINGISSVDHAAALMNMFADHVKNISEIEASTHDASLTDLTNLLASAGEFGGNGASVEDDGFVATMNKFFDENA